MIAARRRLAWVALALAFALGAAACGSSSRQPPVLGRTQASATPGGRGGSGSGATGALSKREPVTADEERVIRGWAATLRQGHVARAARYFALPSVVSNGFDPVRISTRAQARAFNRILTCGAQVLRLERQVHHLVLTTFRLVDRPGPGSQPCSGGGTAQTAFRIEHGRITQWYRVPLRNGGSTGKAS